MDDKTNKNPTCLNHSESKNSLFLLNNPVWYTAKTVNRIYISPHIANVSPSGAKRFGNESETSPVPTPLIGSMFARALTATIMINETTTSILHVFLLLVILNLNVSFITIIIIFAPYK